MKSHIKFNCKSFKTNFQGRNDSKNTYGNKQMKTCSVSTKDKI